MLSFSFSSLGFIFTFSLLQMWHMTTAQFAINKRRKGGSSYLFGKHVEIPLVGQKFSAAIQEFSLFIAAGQRRRCMPHATKNRSSSALQPCDLFWAL